MRSWEPSDPSVSARRLAEMADRGDTGLIMERPESPPEGEDTSRADVAPAQPPLIPLELQVVVTHPSGAEHPQDTPSDSDSTVVTSLSTALHEVLEAR